MPHRMKIFLFAILSLFGASAWAQDSQAARLNIHFDTEKPLQVGQTTTLIIEVEPKGAWHVYSALPSEEGAYRPAEVGWDITSRGFEAVGTLQEDGRMTEKLDEIMGGMVRYYEQKVIYRQTVKITEVDVAANGYFDYMACDESQCIPFTATFELKAAAQK
jgi:DsbC/DsbD-like thiol-disulfide interchange protein